MKKVYTFVVVLVCSAMGIASAMSISGQNSARPWFCHGLDCPYYTITDSTDVYEVREYESSLWASTVVESYAYGLAVPIGFQRLFNYIDGGNKDSVKIPMTSPVLVKTEPPCGPFCKQNFTISFFVPFHLQDDTPKPVSEDIFIQELPSFTAYVAQSGGFKLDDFSLARMAEQLADALDADGIDYECQYFFFAGYDPPFRISGRHNEVWFLPPYENNKVVQRPTQGMVDNTIITVS